MKTISQNYSRVQAAIVVASLLADSRWFEVEPQPFDVYTVTVKNERPLPEPLAPSGLAAMLNFDEWIAEVEKHYVDGLAPEAKEEFRSYFARGLTPSEVIYQDREDAGA